MLRCMWGLNKRLTLGIAAFALALSSVGCSTSWHKLEHTREHRLPKQIPIYLIVSDNVAGVNDHGLVLAMVDALEVDLRERGHSVSLVPAHPDETPPVPRVELQVLEQERANAGMQGAGALAFVFGPLGAAAGTAATLAGRGNVIVDCYVVNRESRVTFSGRLEAFDSNQQQAAISAGENAGRAIARSLAN